MGNRIAKLILAAPALALAGCGGTLNRGLEPVHVPVVTHSDYIFDLNTNGSHLAQGEDGRLRGWLASLRLAYGDHVAFDDPSGANADARADVGAVLADYGMFLDDQPPVTAGALAPGAVRVIVMRSVAKVPGCPDYSRDGKPNFGAHTSSNFGCAGNSTLAAMVANPDDLVRGQPGARTIDPAVSAKAIQTLRKAVNTGAAGVKTEGTGKQ